MEPKLYDECFHVEKTKWGTWNSVHVDGRKLITSLSEEQCIAATRFYLKGVQEKWDNYDQASYSGVVDGKL